MLYTHKAVLSEQCNNTTVNITHWPCHKVRVVTLLFPPAAFYKVATAAATLPSPASRTFINKSSATLNKLWKRSFSLYLFTALLLLLLFDKHISSITALLGLIWSCCGNVTSLTFQLGRKSERQYPEDRTRHNGIGHQIASYGSMPNPSVLEVWY